MSDYNASHALNETPINPLSWIAGTNTDRKNQQQKNASPTAADADAQVGHPFLVYLCASWFEL